MYKWNCYQLSACVWEQHTHAGAGAVAVCVGLARTIYIYTVYIRYFWLGNHQIYGVYIRIYTVLANPTYVQGLQHEHFY